MDSLEKMDMEDAKNNNELRPFKIRRDSIKSHASVTMFHNLR